MAAIGIDLGTTNSCVAARLDNGNVEVIINNLGKRTTPSVIAFCDDDIYFGEHARNKMKKHPESVIYGVKYLMGRKYSDYYVQNFANKCNFAILQKDEKLMISVNNEFYRPEELSALLLKDLKYHAERYLDKEVETAVITVPTYFGDLARQATVDAGILAGFKNVSLLNEPTAAALAYGIKITDQKTILVFDFGGGTFDISVLKIDQNECTVLAIDGDVNMGGDDIDNNLTNYLTQKLLSEYGEDIKNNKRKKLRLKALSEMAKIALSTEKSTGISLTGFVSNVSDDDDDVEILLTRNKFDEINFELFSKCIEIMESCLRNINLKKDDIDAVLLVGGSTRNCGIRDRIEKSIGKIKQDINPDEAVAIGAAIMASSSTGNELKEVKVKQITSHSLGTSTIEGFSCLIPKFTQIPTSTSKEYVTYPKGNPDVDIDVYVGESPITKENKFLGKFKIEGVFEDPDGERRVTVTFEVDSNAILNVTADDHHGNSGQLAIKLDKGNLSIAEIKELTEKIERKYIAYKRGK